MRLALAVLMACFLLSSPAQAEKPCKPVPGEYKDKPEALVKKYKSREAEMLALDKNCDGILQADELKQGRQTNFADADINKDGKITPAEAQAMVGQIEQKNTGDKDSSDVVKGRRVKKMESRLRIMDTNENGSISQSEYDAYYKNRQEKLDRDGDGKLDIREYRTDTEPKK